MAQLTEVQDGSFFEMGMAGKMDLKKMSHGAFINAGRSLYASQR